MFPSVLTALLEWIFHLWVAKLPLFAKDLLHEGQVALGPEGHPYWCLCKLEWSLKCFGHLSHFMLDIVRAPLGVAYGKLTNWK